jgi:fatty acid desaturase
MTERADHPKKLRRVHRPSLFDLARFVFFSGLTVLAAWIAAFGRVAYTLIMLVVAAALAYAVLDLVDYELVKRKRQG